MTLPSSDILGSLWVSYICPKYDLHHLNVSTLETKIKFVILVQIILQSTDAIMSMLFYLAQHFLGFVQVVISG